MTTDVTDDATGVGRNPSCPRFSPVYIADNDTKDFTMRNTDALDLHQVPVFNTVPAKRLPKLRSLLTAVETRKATTVINQGTFALEFLVLTSGKATVSVDDQVVAELTAGDVFGEVAMLSGERRNATVVVEQGSQLLAANQVEFRTILSEFPEIADRIAAVAAARN